MDKLDPFTIFYFTIFTLLFIDHLLPNLLVVGGALLLPLYLAQHLRDGDLLSLAQPLPSPANVSESVILHRKSWPGNTSRRAKHTKTKEKLK